MEPSREAPKITFRECEFCKEALRVAEFGDYRHLVEVASGNQHVCWQNLPSDANLLVLDE